MSYSLFMLAKIYTTGNNLGDKIQDINPKKYATQGMNTVII